MKRALLLIGLVAALAGSVARPAAATDPAPAATERLPALDQKILAGLNATRAAHGLRPLVLSPELRKAADFHSKTMLSQGFFDHNTPGGAPFAARLRGFYQSAGYNTWSVGENLLYSNAAVTVKAAIDAWLASPAHRANMLLPDWREVGIGSMHSSSAGGVFAGDPTWVITMDFGTRSGKGAASNANVKASGAKTGKPKGGNEPKGAGAAKKKPNSKVTKPGKSPAKPAADPKSPDPTVPMPPHDNVDEDPAPSGTGGNAVELSAT